MCFSVVQEFSEWVFCYFAHFKSLGVYLLHIHIDICKGNLSGDTKLHTLTLSFLYFVKSS
jgi:hypothetical protein